VGIAKPMTFQFGGFADLASGGSLFSLLYVEDIVVFINPSLV